MCENNFLVHCQEQKAEKKDLKTKTLSTNTKTTRNEKTDSSRFIRIHGPSYTIVKNIYWWA